MPIKVKKLVGLVLCTAKRTLMSEHSVMEACKDYAHLQYNHQIIRFLPHCGHRLCVPVSILI